MTAESCRSKTSPLESNRSCQSAASPNVLREWSGTMNNRRPIAIAAVVLTCLAQTVTADAQQLDATVQFGSPQPQPAGAASHVLVPDEVTIPKNGIVSFVVNGGGHGIGIYKVANHTTRADITEDLCQGGT